MLRLLALSPADVLEDVTSEDTSCQYGLSVFLLQSARRGFTSAELEYLLVTSLTGRNYLVQLGWPDSLCSIVSELYVANKESLRRILDHSSECRVSESYRGITATSNRSSVQSTGPKERRCWSY